jgi:hypothetical protein
MSAQATHAHFPELMGQFPVTVACEPHHDAWFDASRIIVPLIGRTQISIIKSTRISGAPCPADRNVIQSKPQHYPRSTKNSIDHKPHPEGDIGVPRGRKNAPTAQLQKIVQLHSSTSQAGELCSCTIYLFSA